MFFNCFLMNIEDSRCPEGQKIVMFYLRIAGRTLGRGQSHPRRPREQKKERRAEQNVARGGRGSEAERPRAPQTMPRASKLMPNWSKIQSQIASERKHDDFQKTLLLLLFFRKNQGFSMPRGSENLYF